jgi:hypothetical protein
MRSINHPWAISDKYRTRYGNVWADLDFIFQEKISEENFQTDPMNTNIGHLSVHGQQIKMNYRDLLTYSKSTKALSEESYISGNKMDVYDVQVKSYTIQLHRHELAKLAETLTEATNSTMRAYELGLYL